MAYSAGGLTLLNSGNGFGTYRYDSTDDVNSLEVAGYFNNSDDNLNLRVGDVVYAFEWATAVRTGTLAGVKAFAVTNVIANDAAASAGNVNLAEILISTAGALSSNL